MEKTVAFCTLGCKVNQYESEAVLEQFLKKGYQSVDFAESADVYVINTCTVTHLSDRKSRQMIRRAKQMNPHAVLVVMGCYAQTAPKAVEQIEGVDIIIGTGGRGRVVELVEAFIKERKPQNLVCDLAKDCVFEPLAIDGSAMTHTRAYLKVQDGCNQFCSYCIIPYARGRIRSRSVADSVHEARRMVAAGFSELVLTGIHLASWGRDSSEGTLIDLLAALQQVDGLKRIRLGSLEPTLCDDVFTERVAAMDKVCHHFHLSLQSGCDATLKRMNRKYSTAQYREAVGRLRAAMPDAAITTDVIVGFPEETDAEFNETVRFLTDIELADAHIFKYSPRKGTPAAKMPQIAPEVKENRSHILLRLTEQSRSSFVARMVGRDEPVLFEQVVQPNLYEGKTENYVTVLVPSAEKLSGSLRMVRLTKAEGGTLHGVLL